LAIDAERQIERGEAPTVSRIGRLKTFGHLIDLHISDMEEVGKAPGRSKDATLKMLKRELGSLNVVEIDRGRIVKFGRKRAARRGAGNPRHGIGAIKLVIQHAAAVHGVPVQVEPIDLERVALKRLGLIGKFNERNRRPYEEELAKLFNHWAENARQLTQMSRIVRFAIATAMGRRRSAAWRGATLRLGRRCSWSGTVRPKGGRRGTISLSRCWRLRLRRHGPDRGATLDRGER
jgi:hypothetical protein